MRDVLFYQNYSPVADISTMAICIIYLLLLRSTYTIKQKNLTMFKVANVLVLFAAMTSVFFHQYVTDITEGNRILVYAFRDASYISLILVYVVLNVYLKNLVDMDEKGQKALRVALWSSFAFFSIAEVVSPLTKWGFYIDDELKVHQNYYFDIFRIAYLFYSVIAIVLMVTHRKKFISKMYRCLCSVMIVAFSLILVQSFFLQTSYTCITFTFPIMAILFLFHYNSYDADTGTLDSRAFRAYVRELGDTPFTMICLYLQDMNMDKMQDISQLFFHFSEHYFKDTCTFRLRDDKIVLIYKDDKNPYADKRLPAMIRDFERLYDTYKIEYRVVVIHSDEELRRASQYVELDEYIEEKMPINTVYHCMKRDVESYIRMTYVLEEMRDIQARQDLDDERVKVYCQPVLNTETNLFTSAEALMRMELPRCGMVYPDEFIPLAEKHEYIHTLSKIILNKTCRQIRDLEREGYKVERISVNFSITELGERSFCDDVIGIIRQNGIPFDKIAIELTESRNEKDFENVKSIMSSLQGLGVKFYLDDFGTGYSNFERIIGLPIDIIKFDRSLTILAGRDAESRFLVGSFSNIFQKSNYQILFEGVEDERDEEQCKEMNALYLQGYKYSKPIPIEQLTRFLDRAG